MALTLDGTLGITFPDATNQATKGLPLTGGTLTGGLTVPSVTTNTTIAFSNGDTQNTAPIGSAIQAWTNVTSSRAINTTYTNNTGRPIVVALFGSASNGSAPQISATIAGLAGIPIGAFYTYDSAGVLWAGNVIVPVGATYLITGTGGTSISNWYELR